MSAKHREALGHLLYGVTVEGGFVMLTGEVGTGKTTICRSLLEQMPDNTDVAFVLNPLQNAREMLQSICDELHIQVDKSDANLRGLSNALYKFLLANHSRGRNTVLLIDEAQNLDTKVLELIRLLTNLETNTKKLLQIIFIGQPELRELLAKPELRQLAQRITARYHIEPLSLAETRDYIRHRLQVAGLPANQQLFKPSLVKAIHKHAQGIPRVINILCDRLLLGAYTENKSQADSQTFKKAVREISGTGSKPHKLAWALAAGIAAAALIAWQWKRPEPPAPVINAATEAAAELGGFSESQQALQALLPYLGIDRAEANPMNCESLPEIHWHCQAARVKNWQELMQINRPALLTLKQQGDTRYLALLGIEGNEALLQTAQGERRRVLMALGNAWNGELVYLWQGPNELSKPLALGDRGPLVNYVASLFADLDQQPHPLTQDTYNQRLAQRVKLFQRAHGLTADGVVGMKTLLKLNEESGLAITLSSPVRPPTAVATPGREQP